MATTATRPPTDAVIDEDLRLLEAAFEALSTTSPLTLLKPEGNAGPPELFGQLLRAQSTVSSHLIKLGFEQLRIALGTDDVVLDKRDRRFADEWYRTNPFFSRLARSHVATERRLQGIIDDLDLDPHTRNRARYLTTLMTSALAPSNHLLGNPSALKRAWSTRGRSLADGMRNLLEDLQDNDGLPSSVDRSAFERGSDLCATPGAVVHRTERFELLQYTPTTTTVRQRPVVVVPPQINKYYVLDLAPGRSLAEHLVANGHQVFMISWRNPGIEDRHWDLDDYIDSTIDAIGASLDIAGADDVNLLGVCAGGITAGIAAAYLAATSETVVNSLSLLVTILDWDEPSMLGSLLTPQMIDLLQIRSDLLGTVPGSELTKAFAFLRPNDLVWNYWVNNYLHGEQPAAFDVLAWNADATNLPGGLQRDFLSIISDNALTEPGGLLVKGVPIDLGQVEADNYLIGAVTDHITPWRACHRTTSILGGDSTFVLSSQGHIQAMVNPPGNPKASYQVNLDAPDGVDADTWLAGASTTAGSWWDHWMAWLDERAGDEVDAPTELGGDAHPTRGAAPGTYVLG